MYTAGLFRIFVIPSSGPKPPPTPTSIIMLIFDPPPPLKHVCNFVIKKSGSEGKSC